MLDVASGLQSRGYEVRLVARPGSALAARAPSQRVACVPIEMRGDIDPRAVGRLATLFRRLRPDVICPNLDREVRLCALARGIADRFRARCPTARLIPRRGSEFPLKNRWHYRFVYTRAVHSVVVNSRATQNTMCARVPWFPPERTRLVYNGIDFSEFDVLVPRRDALRAALRERIGARRQSPIVVLVGELNERKGQHLIVEAAPRLLAARPDAHIVFVGEGDARSSLVTSIRSAGVERAVHLLGFRDDVPEILVSSDVLVLPSTVEGFGYVLIEAMAAGLPVVASHTSSIPEIVDDGVTGRLHEVGNVPAIADTLIGMMESPDAARQMGAQGRRVARAQFSIGRMLDELETVYFG